MRSRFNSWWGHHTRSVLVDLPQLPLVPHLIPLSVRTNGRVALPPSFASLLAGPPTRLPGCVQSWGGDGLVPAFYRYGILRGRAVPAPARPARSLSFLKRTSRRLLSWAHGTILRCRINPGFRSQVERRIYAAEAMPEEICTAPSYPPILFCHFQDCFAASRSRSFFTL